MDAEGNVKLVTQPKVLLVGASCLDPDAIYDFLEYHNIEWPEFKTCYKQVVKDGEPTRLTNDGTWLIELAARTCYMSFGSKGRCHEDHLKHILEVGHGSVLEHIQFNFQIWNVSRSLTHELVRHRAGFAYSQISQRYVDSSHVNFVVPPAIQQLKNTNENLYQAWVDHMQQSVELYSSLTDGLSELYQDIQDKTEKQKKARQAARSVLPNATETKIFTSINGRAVRHFIEMRAHSAADLEIRQLAIAIFKIVNERFPMVVYGMNIIILPDGTEGIESQYKKV